MMRVRLRLDDRVLRRRMRRLERREIPRITAQALNRTAPRIRTRVARELAKRTGFGVSVLRRRMKIVRARVRQLFAVLDIRTTPVPLIFGRRVRQGPRGVRANAALFPGSFIATMPRGGHTGVFRRRPGAGRLPIEEVKIPIQTDTEELAERAIRTEGNEIFSLEFERALRNRLRRLGL